jgi:hypothetical protein
MQTLSLVWGILALIGMLIAFIPCLGALNWINIPFAAVGLVFSFLVFGTSRAADKSGSIAGIICCLLACVLGVVRLALGGGIL